MKSNIREGHTKSKASLAASSAALEARSAALMASIIAWYARVALIASAPEMRTFFKMLKEGGKVMNAVFKTNCGEEYPH